MTVFVFALFISLIPGILFAFPDVEILGTGDVDPPFDFSVSSIFTGFVLTSDGELAASYSESLKLVDMGLYALEADQPPAASSEHGTDGRIAAIAFDSGRSRIIASQEDGDILLYNLSDITAEPARIVVVADHKLGPIALDMASNVAYVADNTARSIQVIDLNSETVTSQVMLLVPGTTSFTLTDAVFVSATDEMYFTTSAGRVFYMGAGGAAATRIDVDTTGTMNLSCLEAFPDGTNIYVVDSTTPNMVRINTSSHLIANDSIDISLNPSPTDIAITRVTDPDATYAYVAGAAAPGGGVSVINTSNDAVLDMGTDPDKTNEPIPIATTPQLLAASGYTDGFVYMGMTSGKVGVLTGNPFIKSISVVYSSGGTSLKPGESFTVTFQSDHDGTWQFRANGSVDASGTLLTDSSGNTSGSVVADTDTAVTFNYDDNSAAFTEGANSIYVFVTAGANRGRRAIAITVDTPPANVVMQSAGFGNTRVYITFNRIDVSDMSYYNIYMDPDPAAVLVKPDVTSTASQASSGSTQTATVGGLTNGSTYYIAMEAVDAAGNKSAARTGTFSSGAVASAMPEATVGPAGLLGEKGCGLVGEGRMNGSAVIIFIAGLVVLVLRRRLSSVPVCHCEERSPSIRSGRSDEAISCNPLTSRDCFVSQCSLRSPIYPRNDIQGISETTSNHSGMTDN